MLEVAVEGGGKALEADPKRLVQALEHGDGKGGLRVLAVGARRVGRRVDAQKRGVALQHHPHTGYEQLKLAVIEAAVPVQVLLEQ